MRSFITLFLICAASIHIQAAERPHIILVMTDDQGWGQTGYQNHPHLKTPNLDAMAANGLRFTHFYAGASNCSPTRATVLTGRSNDRAGVFDHGYPLRLQERTVAQALRDNGYATAHLGKWHLNGLRGPGIPILKEDSHNPGAFGFDTWFSVSNFFDYDPLISRQGTIEQHRGDSSEIIVREALKFLRANQNSGKPFFIVIWYGSPHAPMIADETDRAPFQNLPEKHQHHLGELKAMDRSIGALRNGLRQLGIARNTLLWFNSDNGGLPGYGKEAVGNLRGHKNTMYEGGLRVPGIIEWPAVIQKPRTTSFRAGTMDIFPTIAEAAALPYSSMLQPQDGISLMPLFEREIAVRPQPLFFHHRNRGVVIDGDHKLIAQNKAFELYNLANDDEETRNLYKENDPVSQRLLKLYSDWKISLNASREGKDYVEGVVLPNNPKRRLWKDDPAYQPYLQQFQQNVH